MGASRKSSRKVGNLVNLLPGAVVRASESIRRMADTEPRRRRDEVGPSVRGFHPNILPQRVTDDDTRGLSHVVFAPRPTRLGWRPRGEVRGSSVGASLGGGLAT